jgi:hypothetical protein
MLHPVINQIGVDTQNELLKKKKRLRYDNSPYGQIIRVKCSQNILIAGRLLVQWII